MQIFKAMFFDTVKEPLSYYPNNETDKPFRRSVSMTKLGNDMLKQQSPELKLGWIERGNPIIQSPDTTKVLEAFSKLEFKVVVDQFITDTAALADIILPAKDLFEQSDVIGSYWSPYVQFKPGFLSSPGDVKPESEIYYMLAKKMGIQFEEDCIPEPGNENIEKWIEKRISGYTDLTLSDLKGGPVLAPGLQNIAYSDLKFETPSGQIELYSTEASEKWNVSSLPDYVPVNSGNIEKYPLIFLTPNTASRIHSQFGNLELINETVVKPAIEISFADAEKRRISSGDKVRVFNDTGQIINIAKVSNRVREGTVVFPNGVWFNEGGGGNFLITARETDMGYGAAFHDNLVEIETVSE